jgi:hypothetical protein
MGTRKPEGCIKVLLLPLTWVISFIGLQLLTTLFMKGILATAGLKVGVDIAVSTPPIVVIVVPGLGSALIIWYVWHKIS